MGCQNCGTSDGVPKGCKSNGSCGTGGCGKLPVFDWLANVQLPNGQSEYDILEIRFKNSRKAFYRNGNNFSLQVGDVVVVEASPGYDIGIVSVVGELARIQVRKKTSDFKPHDTRKIIRIATQADIDKWKNVREREYATMLRARQIASDLALQMKISDVEYQGDGTKAIFYYTADERIDFRQLIKDLAEQFFVKIEMKQIGARQEAARLGGIGSCGRELCCSTWLTDFRTVSTASARYQQLSLNPQKLAGQCGKLKCCLNYELDVYVEALKEFPKADTKLITEKGRAFHIKTDVFKKQMWFAYEPGVEGNHGFIPLHPERVHEIIKMNKEGKKPADLAIFIAKEVVEVPDYTDVVGQDSLNRFEHVFKKKKKKKKRNPNQQGQGGQNQPQNQLNQPKQNTNPKQAQPQNQNNNPTNPDAVVKKKKRKNFRKRNDNNKPNNE